MTFKLRIRGRDYFESSTAANPANPLILEEQEAELSAVAANDATVQDLTQHTISRLAGLAGQAFVGRDRWPTLTDSEHSRAREYHSHHFGCKTCCAGGQGRGNRCEIGMGLWTAYQQEEPTL
ncbi:MAG: hypothetical protein D4R98_02560 [Comamonadaceae bacterium]|nr:MAG: hypothetical protein D4R98_02560 [Comamonadaceae bacterium]